MRWNSRGWLFLWCGPVFRSVCTCLQLPECALELNVQRTGLAVPFFGASAGNDKSHEKVRDLWGAACLYRQNPFKCSLNYIVLQDGWAEFLEGTTFFVVWNKSFSISVFVSEKKCVCCVLNGRLFKGLYFFLYFNWPSTIVCVKLMMSQESPSVCKLKLLPIYLLYVFIFFTFIYLPMHGVLLQQPAC